MIALVISTDGPKSLVRHTLDLAFEGSTFKRNFLCRRRTNGLEAEPRRATHLFLVSPEEFNKDEGDILFRLFRYGKNNVYTLQVANQL